MVVADAQDSRLEGPAGPVETNQSFQFSDGILLDMVAGDYTFTVDGGGDSAGDYAFRLLDLATATPVTLGSPVSGTLTPANATNLYQFTAAAGDQVFFDAQTSSGSSLNWRLIDPYGNDVFYTGWYDIDTQTLTAAGTYSLMVQGNIYNTAASADFTFNLDPIGNVPPVPFSGTPLTLGAATSGEISAAGEIDSYIFILAANRRLYFDSLSNNASLTWSLDGPAGGGDGPACIDCHTAGSPLTLTNCTSCHNWPPDGQTPAGNQYPNRNGAHAVHNTLAGVNGNCSVCHQGAGTESVLHFNGGDPASVSLASTYNAQSGGASYNNINKTCGTTRCHGGQTTLNWFNGSVDVASDCEQCHSTNPGQYNAATSGEHRAHVVEEGVNCTQCHNPTLLAAGHFSNLATTGFEGDPWDTLNASLGYNHSTRRGCDVGGCHGPEEW